MNWFLLAVSIVFSIAQTALFTLFSKRVTTDHERLLYITVSDGAAAIVILISAIALGGFRMPSLYTVILGLFFGVLSATTYSTNMLALSCGPMSYTVLFTNCSMIIPALSGRFFFGEPTYILQYVGILLLIIAFYFIFNPKKNEALSPKWFLLTISTFVASGLVGILQKVHQSSENKDEIYMFLLIAFVTATVIMTFTTAANRKSRVKKPKKEAYTVLAFAAICGVFIGACNIMNMYLSGVIDSAVFFPLVNGLYIIGSGAASVIFFKEKMTKKKAVAFAIGIAAIILIGNVIPLKIAI